MSYVHVIVSMKKSPSKAKEKTKHYMQLDCTKDEALEDILVPYASDSNRILVEGAFISAADIEKIAVFESSDDSKTLYDKESAESEARSARMASQGVIGFFGTTMYAAIHNQATDITSQILREAMKRQ